MLNRSCELVDLLASIRGERYARYGITVESIHSPPSSRDAFNSGMPHIFLGPSDERERELDGFCEIIRMASEAGLRALLYNVTVLGILRTGPRYDRGGATLSSFKYADLDQSLPEFEGGAADADTMWERIDYFLARVVPVANEYRVQLACHPQDPGIKDYEYRGVARVMGTVGGLKKFTSMHENPYHSLNFCQGTVSEMLERPGEEIYDVIRYFGSRKKIFNVHFRNIKDGYWTSSRSFLMRATWTCCGLFAPTRRLATRTCSCPTMSRVSTGMRRSKWGSHTATGTSTP